MSNTSPSTLNTPINPPTKLSLDFIFAYSYLIAFIGSMFYGITSIVYANPTTIIISQNVSIFMNILIGTCGIISLFSWFGDNQIPIIGPLLLPNGTSIILDKVSNNNIFKK